MKLISILHNGTNSEDSVYLGCDTVSLGVVLPSVLEAGST